MTWNPTSLGGHREGAYILSTSAGLGCQDVEASPGPTGMDGSHVLGATTCSHLSSYLCFTFTPIYFRLLIPPSTNHDVYQVLLHAEQLKVKARKQKGIKFDLLWPYSIKNQMPLEIKPHMFS